MRDGELKCWLDPDGIISVFVSHGWDMGLVAEFTRMNLFFSPVRSVEEFTTGFFCLLGLRKHFGRLHRYFARVVSSISLTFCYLLKQPGLFSFKRSMK